MTRARPAGTQPSGWHATTLTPFGTSQRAAWHWGVPALRAHRALVRASSTQPARRDAAKRLARATDDAAKWSDRAWRKQIRPTLKELFKGRNAALGVAGAAVPAGREAIDAAAVRLGLKQREERHWGMFFLGLLLGAAAGAVVALLTAPKRGSEMRRELGERADEVRHEIAEKAKDAEWVPMFQREGAGNGHAQEAADAFADATGNVQEGAAATGEAAEAAATDTAEAINEAYESVDRESTT